MKTLLTTIILLTCITVNAQTWTTAQLSVKVREMKAIDSVMQINLNNLNAGIVKALAVINQQDIQIAKRDSIILSLQDGMIVQDGRFYLLTDKIKSIQTDLDAIRTVYFDINKFLIKGDTITIR